MSKLFWLGLLACTSACVMSDDAPLSKQEAAELLESGKADSTFDPCAEYGWYHDGVCDDFCPQPDPDCDIPCTSSYQCPPRSYCSTEDGDCDSVCPEGDQAGCPSVCGGVCLPDDSPDQDGGPAPDGGVMDGGPAPDGGVMDGGPRPDGGVVDGGPAPDGGVVDGGPAPDGGVVDGGPAPV